MRKACIVIALTGAVGVITVILLAGFVFFSFVLPNRFPEDPEPGVVHSEIAIDKSIAVTRARLGFVSDIRHFPDAPAAARVGIAGGEGVLLVSEDFVPGDFHLLTIQRDLVRFAGVDTRGFTHLIGVESWQGATVYDAVGKALWSPPRRNGVNSVAGADLLGDGTMQFVVGYNGGGGVWLHDEEGNDLWNQPDGNVWRVAAMQRPGEDDWLIVHSNAGGQMKFRGADGSVIATHKPRGYFSSFSLSPWPDAESHSHLVYFHADTVWVYDAHGAQAATYDAPLDGRLGSAYATPVRFQADGGPHFAVLVKLFMRSALFIYDERRHLVHHEVLPDPVTGIAAFPEPGAETESLLVGGWGEVWRYRWDESGTASGP